MKKPSIPPALIGVASGILAEVYTHSDLDVLFMSAGLGGDPPPGMNKVTKCRYWLRQANETADPLVRFGRIIAEFMDAPEPQQTSWAPGPPETFTKPRDAIRAVLKAEGLVYQRGGVLFGARLTGPSASLREQLAEKGIEALEHEFRRAYENVESDPAAAVTAACSILETVCKTYLESVAQPLPSDQSLKPLWTATAKHLGLDPKVVADDDLKRILSGMYSVADGVASLRTHAGSAHGRAASFRYKLEARHARLAVHSAHTLAVFVMETSKSRAAPEQR
jgi:hypothetical protein